MEKFGELDVVRLKDGRKGTVLDFFDGGSVVLLEIADSHGRTLDLPFVPVEEVDEILYSHKAR